MPDKDPKNYTKKQVTNAWCMYDWGSSAFSTTVEAAVLPVYFEEIARAVLESNLITAYWGYANSISLFLAALLSPILGSIADYTGSKKKLLGVFAALGIVATAFLVTITTGDWIPALVLFIIGSLSLGASYIFYDALLGHITDPEERDYVSSKGYALGYLGGGIVLAINIAMIWFLEVDNWGTRLSFLSVAIWWAIFTLPLLKRVPEPPANTADIQPGMSPIKAGFQRLLRTFSELSKYRELFKFLVAFWLYNDGIGTVIKMATIYGKSIGIGTLDLIGALLLTQFVGIPFALLFGKFGKVIGTKRAIIAGLAWYGLITIAAYFISASWHFWVLAFAVGMVQGGTQALSRSLYSQMAPAARSAEFFGFYDISTKFSGIGGPLVFGLVSQLIGQSRLGIVSILFFFVAGIIFLSRVDEKEGIRVAEEENARVALA